MNAVTVHHYGRKEMLKTFPLERAEQWTTVLVTTHWTARDVLAHLTSYERLLEDVLKSVVGQTPTPTLEAMAQDHEHFNDQQVAQRLTMKLEELWDEYTQAHDRIESLLMTIGPEKLRQTGTIPWYGEEYSLDDYIVYANYAHIREHVAQVHLTLRHQA